MTTEIQLPVSELKPALAGFQKIIAKSSTLPVLRHLRVTRTHDASVHLQATNLDDFATFTLEKKSTSQPTDTLVPLEALLKLVKGRSPTDTICLIQKGKEIVLNYPIGSTRIDQRMERLDLNEWPPVPSSFSNECRIPLEDEFKSALKGAFDCASDDETRVVLNSAFIDVSEPSAHYIVGTDGRHMFSANSFSLDLKQSLIVPSRPFLSWNGFSDDGNWSLALIPEPQKGTTGWIRNCLGSMAVSDQAVRWKISRLEKSNSPIEQEASDDSTEQRGRGVLNCRPAQTSGRRERQ